MSSYGTIGGNGNRTDSELLVRDNDRFRTDTPFEDKLFAIVFVIWFILITILSLFFFVQNEDTFESHSQNSDDAYLNQHFWNLLLFSILISTGTSILLLFNYHTYPHRLIWIAFISSCFLWLLYGMTLIISFGCIVLGLFVLFIALIELLWIYLSRDRIQFTTALLELGIQGLKCFISTYFITILGLLLQITWIIIWAMGFVYSIDGTEATKATIILYILAYYWIFQVISNIVLCTICGSVAMWYFFYPEHTPSHAVYNAFKRSVTRSFGSICYGSVVIAFVQTIRSVIYILYALIRETRRNHHRCAGCLTVCVSGLLRCMGGVIEYVDCYVFVRISVYGTDFCSSATETMELFRCKGFDMIINDDLTNSVVLLSCFMCSSVTGLLIGVLSKYAYDNGSVETIVLWSFTAFVISFALSMSCMVSMKAAVCAIIVCFAEDPAVLSFTKPNEYDFLTNAWNTAYGSLPKKLTNPPRAP